MTPPFNNDPDLPSAILESVFVYFLPVPALYDREPRSTASINKTRIQYNNTIIAACQNSGKIQFNF